MSYFIDWWHLNYLDQQDTSKPACIKKFTHEDGVTHVNLPIDWYPFVDVALFTLGSLFDVVDRGIWWVYNGGITQILWKRLRDLEENNGFYQNSSKIHRICMWFTGSLSELGKLPWKCTIWTDFTRNFYVDRRLLRNGRLLPVICLFIYTFILPLYSILINTNFSRLYPETVNVLRDEHDTYLEMKPRRNMRSLQRFL